MRALVLVPLLATSIAAADVRFTAGIDYQKEDHSFGAQDWTAYPGPSLALDAWGASGFGFHGAFHTGFSTYRDSYGNEPCCSNEIDMLLELHMLYAARANDAVTFELGTGLNVLGYSETYSSDNNASGNSYTSLGLHGSIGVDIATISSSSSSRTVQIVGGISMYSIPQAIGLCGGELSCHRQVWTFSLGVGLAR